MSFDLFKFQEWPTKTIFVRLLDLFLKKHVSHLQYQTLSNGKGLMSAGIIIFYPTTHNKYQFFSWYISIVSDFASGLLNKSCWLAIGLAFPYCFWKSRFNCKVDENFILSAGTWSGVQAFYRTLLWLKIISLTTFVSFQGQSFISANGQIGVYGELGRTTRGVRQECSLQADDVSGEKTYALFTSYGRHRRQLEICPLLCFI